MKRLSIGLVWVLMTSAATAADVDVDVDRQGLDFFEAKIRPVLIEKCYACHSAGAAVRKKLQAGLYLDTRAGILAGGESGPALIPGKSSESLIVKALRHETVKMPPKDKLDDELIDDFVKWIDMGAPDPRESELSAGSSPAVDSHRDFWSLRPLRAVAPPIVKDRSWTRTTIDRFIRARQEKAGVEPDKIAEMRTLTRRVYFDLLGLPPDPNEVDKLALEAESDFDGTWTRLIDKLLSSDQFGERQARHWLDLARFAESNGYAFDGDRPNAFRYRDFVVKALSNDMPYDEFVRLQIAGDLLAPEDIDAIAATGFLVAGPYTTQQTMKERERSRYEQLDDMIQTIGTAMLGLSIGCARCHDHKYDPLPQLDYYRLAACFADVGFANVGVNTDPEGFRKAKTEFDAAHALVVEPRTRFEKEQLPARLNQWIASRPEEPPEPTLGSWYHLGPFAAETFEAAFDKSFLEESETIDRAATHLDGKLSWTEQKSWKDGAVHNPFNAATSANYLVRTVEAPVARKVGLSLGRDDAIRVWVNGVDVLSKKAPGGVAPDQDKISIQLRKGPNEILMKIVNQGGPSGFYFDMIGDFAPPDVVAVLKTPDKEWSPEARQKVLDWYKTTDDEWNSLNTAVAEHSKKAPKTSVATIFSAKERGTTYGFGADTYKVYFLGRGNPSNKQQEAEPGFLSVLMERGDSERRWMSGEDRAAATASPRTTEISVASTKPARVALGDWLTDTEHGAGALLARVIVNRVWKLHFGRGLVSTPSDFGTRGERPFHPELLEWLATELVQSGWKLKPLHRSIVMSSVYLQGSSGTESGRSKDPDNALLWRRIPRRMEAEVIRDSLLAVSGTLDLTRFGKGSLDQRNPRRSIYLTVKRSQLIPILQLFDAPDTMQGVGARQESIVAPQALALLNSDMVRSVAAKLAERVRPDDGVSIAEAIQRGYRIVFARRPSVDELRTMTAFVETQAASRSGEANAEALALRDFCHALLCMNEFVYVD